MCVSVIPTLSFNFTLVSCQVVCEDFDIKIYVLKILEDRSCLDVRPKNMDVDAFLRYTMWCFLDHDCQRTCFLFSLLQDFNVNQIHFT